MGFTKHGRFAGSLLCLSLLFIAPDLAKAHEFDPKLRVAETSAIKGDLEAILVEAKLPKDLIVFEKLEASSYPEAMNVAELHCADSQMIIRIESEEAEWSSTLYHALQKLGFLFPHPRIQISPDQSRIFERCGDRIAWKPRFKFRGFHLHNQHPSEFVEGYLRGKGTIGHEVTRWLARNTQNVLQLKLLKTIKRNLKPVIRPQLEFAQAMGLTVGADVSFTSLQQKSFRLLDAPYLLTIASILTGKGDEKLIRKTIRKLARTIPFDYLSGDMGTSEFTSTSSEKTLRWLEVARTELEELDKGLFVKIHVSTGQVDPEYGNFNFLPQYSHPGVGIQPHTVMSYGLNDPHAPVYGRKDFKDMRDFLAQEVPRRPVWYFPETSYWIGIDLDVPLFLTDYLLARSEDMDYLEDVGANGVVTFTTGQELGYWLMDWTVALLANSEHRKNPYIGLELLGEDRDTWKEIAAFQKRHFKERDVLSMISGSNLLDELPYVTHKVLFRNTMKELSENPVSLELEILSLENALKELPSLSNVKSRELRTMLTLTWNRIFHAYWVRSALRRTNSKKEKDFFIHEARTIRYVSHKLMSGFISQYERYPEALIFSRHDNPTSYSYGYGWPAAKLHFWEREEEMVRRNEFSPFFMNIYNMKEILF